MGLPPNLECAYGTVRLGKLDSSVNSSVFVIGMQRLIRVGMSHVNIRLFHLELRFLLVAVCVTV